MKIVSLNGQMTFDEMKGSLERLPKTNRWVQMGDALPWTEYEKAYNKRLKNDTVGASNRPGRMVIAALIIKHKLNLSDEETILTIQENPYMQCGLTEYTDKPIFDPSLFVTIRKRITIDDINALTLELARKTQKYQQYERMLDLYVNPGDTIHPFEGANNAIGTVAVNFPTAKILDNALKST